MFLLLSVMYCFNAVGQDPRVSQYQAIPLLVNPAHTGDFDGKVRIQGLGARINSRYSHNYFFNASGDIRLGDQEKWGLGINYIQSGADRYPVSSRSYSLSISREFNLDTNQIQTLRLGGQIGYLTGTTYGGRQEYNRLLDLSAFRYLNGLMNFEGPNDSYKKAYLNFSIGAQYKFELDRFKFKTGFSAYNVTNPQYDFPNATVGKLKKRYRVAALTSLYYQYSQKDAFKVEQYSWKEGIFLRDYVRLRDTVEIHETTYSFTWLHQMRNQRLSLGLYSRSWQSVYGLIGLDFEQFGITASYEVPVLKHYYDIGHLEFGLRLYPFKKKSVKQDRYKQMIKQLPGIVPYDSSFKKPILLKIPKVHKVSSQENVHRNQ